MVSSQGLERLSRREREVLALIAAGLSNKEVAQTLIPPVSINTAKGYVRQILAKLGVPNRAAAASLWSADQSAPLERMGPNGMVRNEGL